MAGNQRTMELFMKVCAGLEINMDKNLKMRALGIGEDAQSTIDDLLSLIEDLELAIENKEEEIEELKDKIVDLESRDK